MADSKSISQLTTAEKTSPSDLFETSIPNGSGYLSRKVSASEIANLVNNSIQYNGLETSAKTIVEAINEANSSGGGGGSGNVDDVKINGTSILDDDKVANIPVAKYHGLGLIQGGGYGVNISTEGYLYTPALGQTQYVSMPNENILGKGTLENAKSNIVRRALTDTNQTAYTDEEKAIVKSTLGIEGEGSTVTMADNANAGVDLTVDGTSRTLAKSSELATVNNALLELTTSKQDKLIAGSGIVISSDGKTISSTGGGSGTCVVVDNADGGVDVSDGTTTRTLATQNGLDEVNDISTALINGENVVSSDLWTGEFLNGYYNADGVFVETNNYKDCTPVDISRYNQLSISVTPTINFTVIIGFFDSEDNITVTQLESVTSGAPYNKTIDIPSNAEKFVVNSRRTSNATYDSWSIIGIIKNPMTDFTSNMELLDGRITSNTTSINTIKSDVYTTIEDYSNIDLSFDNIGWYGSNGVYYSSSDYRYAEVECSAGEKYDVTGRTNWTISPYIVLDSNNSMLYSGSSSGSGSTVTKSERLTIPSGGVKICFSAPKNDTTWKNTCKCVKVINNEKSIVGTTYNALKGVKWGAIGDSFTDPITLSTQTDKRNYVDLIKEQTGVTVVNLGVSGTGYKRTEESNTAFYQRASNVDNDFDVITIFGSGNDQQYSSQAQVGNATDTGTDTLAGCVNTTIDNLLARNPVVRIGIVAPTPWAGYAPFNTNATWMKRYSQMLSDVCTLRGIPFLDLYHESNLRPWDSACMQALYKDDTHPNTEGHKRIASKIKAFLIEIVG